MEAHRLTVLSAMAKKAPEPVAAFLLAARAPTLEMRGAFCEGSFGNDYPFVVGHWTGFVNGTSGLVRSWIGDDADAPVDDPGFREWMERAAEQVLERGY